MFVACGANERPPSSTPIKYASDDIYVDALNGDNINGKGTASKPYKTITYALKKLNSLSSVIYLKAGEYSVKSGELFPLILPKGISLYPYGETNSSITIKGNGYFPLKDKTVCLVLKGNNQLYNLSISSEENIGILSLNGTNSLFSSTLQNNKTALALLNTSYFTLDATTVKKNINGLEINNHATLKLIDSTIQENEVGIILSSEGYIDSHSENSKIINNVECDFFTNGNRNLSLQGIKWDENSSDFTIKQSCSEGNNIVNQGEGTISFQALPNHPPITLNDKNSSSIPNENNISSDEKNETIPDGNHTPSEDKNQTDTSPINNALLFPVKNEINILYPTYDISISSEEPNIRYNNTQNNKYIMVTIWNKLPIIRDKQIQNPKDVFWYWHTGMEGGIGETTYEYGAKPLDGDLNANTPLAPKALKKGRAYYLAIWEWDREGKYIVSSSRISIFHVK